MSSALLRIHVSLARKPIHGGEYAGIVEQGCYPNASPGTAVPEFEGRGGIDLLLGRGCGLVGDHLAHGCITPYAELQVSKRHLGLQAQLIERYREASTVPAAMPVDSLNRLAEQHITPEPTRTACQTSLILGASLCTGSGRCCHSSTGRGDQ